MWQYMVGMLDPRKGASCDSTPALRDPIRDPARFPWHEVKKVDLLDVNALKQSMEIRENPETC